MSKIKALEYEINTKIINNEDYISLTDIAKKANVKDPRIVIQNWMRNKDTIDFIGLWEKYIILILTASNSMQLNKNPDTINL